jgi:8-oxo-dGTP pyrophosphatase MutT (NUDIX family)
MNLTRYVLMVVIDPETRTVVGLIKKKGPSFLIDKVTFPGGKIEQGEHPGAAAGREMFEETGVEIPALAWRVVEIRKTDEMELTVLAAQSSDVDQAFSKEEEPVMTLQIEEHRALARANPQRYSPDFLTVLEGALKALKIAPRSGIAA